MSWELIGGGAFLFNSQATRFPLKFDEFELKRDGENAWVVYCRGRNITHPVARFTGTYIEGAKALKMQLITSRLCA